MFLLSRYATASLHILPSLILSLITDTTPHRLPLRYCPWHSSTSVYKEPLSLPSYSRARIFKWTLLKDNLKEFSTMRAWHSSFTFNKWSSDANSKSLSDCQISGDCEVHTQWGPFVRTLPSKSQSPSVCLRADDYTLPINTISDIPVLRIPVQGACWTQP